MLIEPYEFADFAMLNAVLKECAIDLAVQPSFPISFQDLIQYCITQGVSIEKINQFINHVNSGISLFGPGERGTDSAHKWPDQTRYPSRGVSEELFWAVRKPIVSRSSRIVSLGSCFAVELAKWLQTNGYNYVVTEPNLLEGTDIHGSSARWGGIYNVIGFYQVVSWAFGYDSPPVVCYHTGKEYRDPFREDITYTPEEVVHQHEIWRDHLGCTRAALSTAEIVVLTVGLNEVFRYLPTGHYLHRTPWGMNPAVWRSETLTVERNYQALRAGIERLRAHNPNVQVIISISPVPLVRSFRRDVHVATATGHSKAVLRVAVEQLCQDVPNVHYMASFETVMYPGSKIKAWHENDRYVSETIVNKVMQLFEQQFCVLEDAMAASGEPYVKFIHATNPFFEVDHRIFCQSLMDCVASGVIAAPVALDLVNMATPLLYNGGFEQRAYQAVRSLSVRSRFNFNLLNRQRYREAFPTLFKQCAESAAIRDDLFNNGISIIAATDATRAFAKQVRDSLENCPVRREKDGRVGAFSALAAEKLPGAYRYFFREEDLPAATTAKLYEQIGILRAIGEYIGHPIFRMISAWYTTSLDESTLQDENASALSYHNDNDITAGWTNVFMYLSDVSEENGPHVFVPRSHGEVPVGLAHDGRFTDAEIEAHYGPGIAVCGEAGTILVADTQAYHKGWLTPRKGHRLILEISFSASLFGAETSPHAKAHDVLSGLKDYDPRFLRRFLRDKK